jgi:hypothetical protein
MIDPTPRQLAKLRPSGELVDRFEEFLLAHYPSRKRPTVAASVLAIIIELEQRNEFFPPRQDLAAAWNCSRFGVDAAISLMLARELITLEVKVFPGKVTKRLSTSKERYFHPSTVIRDIANATTNQPKAFRAA